MTISKFRDNFVNKMAESEFGFSKKNFNELSF